MGENKLQLQSLLTHLRDIAISRDDLSKIFELPSPVLIDGLVGSSLSLLSWSLSEQAPLLVILNDIDAAGYLYADLEQLLGEDRVLFFPSAYRRSIKYGHVDEANQLLRTMVVSRLGASIGTDAAPPLIISYPEAIAEAVVTVDKAREEQIRLREGAEISRELLIEQLLGWGYTRVDYVYAPGQFALRGSLMDIYSYAEEAPLRVDFFDDEIESLRYFEVESQLSIEPAKEAILAPAMSRTSLSGSSLLELLRADTIILTTQGDRKGHYHYLDRVNYIYQDAPKIQDGEGFSSLEEMQSLLVEPSALNRKALKHRHVLISSGQSGDLHLHQEAQPRYGRNFDQLAIDWRQWQEHRYQIFISAKTEEQYDRIFEILENRGIQPEAQRIGAQLHEGWIDERQKLVLLTEHQLFDRYHKYNLKSDKAKSGKVTLTLKELQKFKQGDYVVHADHGIGQFAGLMHIDVGGKKQEVVRLIYKGGDSIYVNLHSLHKLSHYRSGEAVEGVQLSALGSGAWHKLKERTKSRVKDIARDLIKLYDRRRKSKGFAFSPDGYLQHALEASFVYDPTPDQLKASEEVKRDMERPYPMDRLLTGDVGFGKTEVAIRAAFKAVTDGKQVAVLVPTTLLAYQHWRNFSKRLKELPVRVEYISRARMAKEIKELLKDLKEGKIDIIIGTHRLTSKDVAFKDLGLLIIDEEQKFGVAVKEKLRKLQVNVDTLTMSATPIPRTLQFSLMGARDLSNIATAPPNRFPIDTILSRFDEETIREAIEFELSRNGQIFFIHNRVQNIKEVAGYLQELVPSLRICIGHGQMTPKELEEVTLGFAAHEYDLFVATTIIENGIDVPNANTIMINEAQRYGLSELHQLRGRVGRGDRKAFCYLFSPPLGSLPEEARRRLQAIEDFSDLGSGIRIALQDLDIRGAGNALGAEQSGFIMGMGYETYQKIFAEAIRELHASEFAGLFEEEKGHSLLTDPSFESDLELSLPSEYVPDDGERILLYRELDNLSEDKDIEAYKARLEDRFGRLPRASEQLILVPKLRRIASTLGVEKIILKDHRLTLYLISDSSHPFYQSKRFDDLIAFAMREYKRCELKETRGKNVLRLKDIQDISEAIALLSSI